MPMKAVDQILIGAHGADTVCHGIFKLPIGGIGIIELFVVSSFD